MIRDRDRTRALYMVGLQATEISKRLGVKLVTVRQWIQRDGLAKERQARKEANTDLVDQVTATTLADAALTHQKRVAKVYERHIDSLAEFTPVAAKEFVDVATALKNLDDVGRRNLGLSTENEGKAGSNTFNFNLNSLNVSKKFTSEPVESAAIDVQTTQVIDSK